MLLRVVLDFFPRRPRFCGAARIEALFGSARAARPVRLGPHQWNYPGPHCSARSARPARLGPDNGVNPDPMIWSARLGPFGSVRSARNLLMTDRKTPQSAQSYNQLPDVRKERVSVQHDERHSGRYGGQHERQHEGRHDGRHEEQVEEQH